MADTGVVGLRLQMTPKLDMVSQHWRTFVQRPVVSPLCSFVSSSICYACCLLTVRPILYSAHKCYSSTCVTSGCVANGP